MRRLDDLTREQRLDLIEEARRQYGQDHVADCIKDNAPIDELCQWHKTLQGLEYWSWVSEQ